MIEAETSALLDWAVATRTLRGESISGDRAVVHQFEGGVLVAVIDGLGHGPAAAAASQAAETALRGSTHGSIADALGRCHAALRGTRGAVVGVASFSPAESVVRWGGVGDVQGVLVRASKPGLRQAMPACGGVLGDRMPALRIGGSPVTRGDTLVLASDGIRSGFGADVVIAEPVVTLAQRLLDRHARAEDDALVLIARWRGGRHE